MRTLLTFRGVVRGVFGGLTAGMLVGQFVGPAAAIPNTHLNPHPHHNPGTVDQDTTWIDPSATEAVADPDPDNPDGTMHQHRDRDALTGGNGKYIGYAVWDDRFYRNGGQLGHGYIDPNFSPRYLFETDVVAAARADFRNAVDEWEQLVNGVEMNVNGVPIRISVDYDEVATGGHEIDVLWNDIGAADGHATAFWDPGATDFTFDSDPSILLGIPGDMIRIAGSSDPFVTEIAHPNGWLFGGTGTPTSHTVAVDCQIAGANCATFTFDDYDFYTIALHEIGHSWGLDHFGTGLMRADISSFVMRDPDAGSIDGVKDLYAIPIPEPRMFVLLAIGLAGLLLTVRGGSERGAKG